MTADERPTAPTRGGLDVPVWPLVLAAIVLLGLVLRLKGLHDPILDHPGWRQGDTAAIARNFATRRFDIFWPQTDYNGPADNYVELELQIVPFLAAIGYKLFGIHEVFGRLITIAFSLGTIVVVGAFARALFASERAGYAAAFLFAVFPGSVYYGRTFTPDTTMTFFFTAALYASERYLTREGAPGWRGWAPAALLTMMAVLAKPVAIVALVPIACLFVARFGPLGTLRRAQSWAFLAVAVVPYELYDSFVKAHAEWLWASGITSKHVLPSLAHALVSPHALLEKIGYFGDALAMLAHTMLGPVGFALLVLGFAVPLRSRSRALLAGWLGAVVAYAFAVVTVERVDYYLYVAVPLAAIVGGGFLARLFESDEVRGAFAGSGRTVAWPALALAALVVIWTGRSEVAPYYAYNKGVYRAAKALDRVLPADATIVMAHYDPSVLYYIGRKGWEEDPYLWTPFDEQSAIRKGARYFVSIENNRFKRNVELYAWMQRFPKLTVADVKWPVYETDPTKLLPGAETRWRDFRNREKAGLLPSEPGAQPVPR